MVYYCCRELKKDWKTLPYCLLGDDIVIGDKEVGEMYIQVIRSLGVEISELKTHKSQNFFEFAKRMFIKGQEITPFPFSALKECSKRYYRLVNLFMEQVGRGYVSQGIPASVGSFYEFIKPLRSKNRSKMVENSWICERMMRIMRDPSLAYILLNEIIRHRGYRIRELKQEECLGILANLAVEMFSETNPENMDKSKDLGQMAITLTCYLSSLEGPDLSNLGFNLIYSLPHLSVYGQVEELFIKFKKEATAIDTVRAGD